MSKLKIKQMNHSGTTKNIEKYHNVTNSLPHLQNMKPNSRGGLGLRGEAALTSEDSRPKFKLHIDRSTG